MTTDNCETTVVNLGACNTPILTDNGNCSYTFDNGEGNVVTFSTDNIVGATYDAVTKVLSLTRVCGNSIDVTIDCCVNIEDNGDGTYTATFTDGTIINWDTNETTSTLVDEGNGTYTYTDEEGSITVIQDVTTTLVGGVNSFTYTNEAGNSVVWNEAITSFANTIAGNTIATYSDEAGGTTPINETITTLSPAGLNSFSYTNEAGTVTNISFSETTSTLTDNGNNSWTYTDEQGTATNISFSETITTIVNNGDGTLTYTNETGSTTDLDICNIIDNCSISALGDVDTVSTPPALNQVLRWDGSMWIPSLSQENTSVLTQIVTSGKLIARHNDGNGVVVDIYETLTTLVDNGDKTFTYTNENGTQTTVDFTDVNTTLVNAGLGIIEYTDEQGGKTQIDICQLIANCSIHSLGDVDVATSAPTIGQYLQWDGNNWVPAGGAGGNTSILAQSVVTGNTIAVHNDGTGTITDIIETVTTASDLNATGISIAQYTSEDGTITQIKETLTSVVNNNDGTWTYTNENNVDQVIVGVSADGNNVLTKGLDNGVYLDCDGVANCVLPPIATIAVTDANTDNIWDLVMTATESDTTPFTGADFGRLVFHSSIVGGVIYDTGIVAHASAFDDGTYTSGTMGTSGTFDLAQWLTDNGVSSDGIYAEYTPYNEKGVHGPSVGTMFRG